MTLATAKKECAALGFTLVKIGRGIHRQTPRSAER